MSNKIEIFKNAEFGEVRVLDIKGEPWFIGKDVAMVLGYTDVSHAVLDHVDDEDRVNSKTQGQNAPEFGQRGTWLINESGLYSLILGSKLPRAKAFKRWVTSEVLPAIRKHGVYAIDEMLNNPDVLIKALTELKEERAKNNNLLETNKQQEQVIRELKPKADYTDDILQSKSLMAITQIAKDYGMSGKAMNAQLHKLGIIYKLGKQWLLYSKYQSCGYTHSETVLITHSDNRRETVLNTKWTQKGRLFLYSKLKNIGVLPVIEQQIKRRYKKMDMCELQGILTKHRAWLLGEQANLAGVDLKGVKLTETDLRYIDFSHANLTEVDFSRADLSNANLKGANLTHAKLRGAKLDGADLRHACLRHADLRGTSLNRGGMQDLHVIDCEKNVKVGEWYDLVRDED